MTVTTSDADVRATQSAAPLVIVSCDTHIGPRVVEDLRPYCPKDLLDDYDAFAGELAAKRQAMADAVETLSLGGVRSGGGVRERNLETPGHHDMHARLRDLDADGVAGEVLFHDSQNGEPIPFQNVSLLAPTMTASQDFDLLEAGQHIYNQWLADVCSIQPERHLGLMHLPMWDIDAAIAELEWARGAGLKGLNFPYPRPFFTPYNDPAWEPFWDACEANEITLCNHGGASASTVDMGPGALSVAKFEMSMSARICPMDLLVYSGAFERHPGLRLVNTESPGAWWQFVMKEMDSIWRIDTVSFGPGEKQRVPKLPSEYAARQVWIGSSFHARFEAEDAIENGYVDRVIWGSDYPHFEGTYQYDAAGPNGEPMTLAAMRFTYHDLPEDVVRKMVGGNAMDAYNFDEAALTKVAERIGAPSYDDLNSAVVPERPADAGFLSFRTTAFWD